MHVKLTHNIIVILVNNYRSTFNNTVTQLTHIHNEIIQKTSYLAKLQ